jgi:hypothetical protein
MMEFTVMPKVVIQSAGESPIPISTVVLDVVEEIGVVELLPPPPQAAKLNANAIRTRTRMTLLERTNILYLLTPAAPALNEL